MTTPTTPDRQDAQRAPLTRDELKKLAEESGFCFISDQLVFYEGYDGLDTQPTGFFRPADALKKFARAIERAHGIGE